MLHIKGDAVARGLASDAEFWRLTLADTYVSHMARQLHSKFAYILIYCDISWGCDMSSMMQCVNILCIGGGGPILRKSEIDLFSWRKTEI